MYLVYQSGWANELGDHHVEEGWDKSTEAHRVMAVKPRHEQWPSCRATGRNASIVLQGPTLQEAVSVPATLGLEISFTAEPGQRPVLHRCLRESTHGTEEGWETP